ncbi:MAG: hypothetical protein ACPGSC_14800 [Granulosicoccaceae bacterium]
MPNHKRPLNTALIGLGMVADAHVKAIAGLSDKLRLRGVFARGFDAANRYAQKKLVDVSNG